jgi:carboxylate-amine ligase
MPLHLSEAFGVEIEYMVVEQAPPLAVSPVVDGVMKLAAAMPEARDVEIEGEGGYPNSVDMVEEISWSNELALHVLELKTSRPVRSLRGLAGLFHGQVLRADSVLGTLPAPARLLPTGMHPLMDPEREMRLWPHDYGEVYAAFNRIFDCRGHGWANLQSTHINLPFCIHEKAEFGSAAYAAADTPESEFGRLHAAIRMVLPILPALSASTPIMEGRLTGLMDNRLEVYRHNARRLPITSGKVIPEPVFTHDGYEREILGAIYNAFQPHDPEGLLRYEWANSRGAIARFMRNAIEIRVLDVQECPGADLAICALAAGVVQAIAEGQLGDIGAMQRWGVDPLHEILLGTIRDGDASAIKNSDYLRALGYAGKVPCTAGRLWRDLFERTPCEAARSEELRPYVEAILGTGCLARRIAQATGPAPSVDRIVSVYTDLAGCLRRNEPYAPR